MEVKEAHPGNFYSPVEVMERVGHMVLFVEIMPRLGDAGGERTCATDAMRSRHLGNHGLST